MIVKSLDVPYYSQLDNKFDPYTACNVTSLAMCLSYYKIKPPDYMQLEDYLFQRAADRGWSRFTPEGIKKLAESFKGIKNHLTTAGTLQNIRESINKGWPVIIHGFFTAPGHIIVIVGYTDDGFIVHDPYGEIMGLKHYRTDIIGSFLHYSNSLIAAACDSWCWGQAKQRYPMSNSEAELCNSMWIHRIECVAKPLLK